MMVLALSTLATAAQVKDGAGFFSPGTVAQADAKLTELKQKYRHGVMVETYADLPAELRGKVDGNEASARQAYNTFGAMRANSLGADVYVLIVRNPSKLEVSASNDVSRSGLTSTGREGLRQELLTGFRAKRFDDALLGMTASLEQTYGNLAARGGSTPAALPPGNAGSNSSRAPTTPTPAPPAQRTGSGFNLGCIGFVVIAVVILLVISLIRRLFAGRSAGYGGNAPPPGYGQGNYGAGGYGGGYPPQGGGGFGRGIAGGLLGGLFGSWLGGNVFGQNHASSQDPNAGQNTGGNDAGTGGDATGFSTSGGDFGDSGSTDAGSGFSTSGGDFGGGDSGGGGGDSGGGGGDF